jgi:2-(1,2-epoxy-1,2-dihydrophenyl)acetyl-CoA isomerase
VVPVADLDRVVDELAQKLARGPRRAMAATKAAIYRGLTGDLMQVLEMETQAQINAVRNGEFNEGAMAFIQRRDPDFRNI